MKRFTFLILTAVISIALFSAACSGNDDSKTTSEVVTTQSSQPNNVAGVNTSDPRVQKIIKAAQTGQIKSVDALKAAAYDAGFTRAEVEEVIKLIGVTPILAQQPGGAQCPQDYHVNPHQEFDVPAGCNVKGDVSVFQDGKWVAKYDNDANTGLVVSCPNGCKIRPDFDGANVTPRDVSDLEAEMKTNGCDSKCTSVTKIVIDTGKPAGATPVPPTATPTPSQPVNDGCEPEIPMGSKRIVKSGCIVVGDVLVRPAGSSADFRPVYDNRQKTGTVQLLTEDTEVWNIQGASVMPKSSDLKDIVMATKYGGCGTGFGCPDGIYDWKGQRLDQ